MSPLAAKTTSSPFPLQEARELVRDLMQPNPRIYWLDFLFHIALGWAGFVVTLALPSLSLWQVVAYLVTSLALYRSVIFIHELAHLKRESFKLFRIVWNVICGFPLMIPAFTYQGVHLDHHKRDVYGTKEDGEYLPFAIDSPVKILLYLLEIVILPLLMAVRFIVCTPISYLHKGLRRILWERASSLSIDPTYRRPPPKANENKYWKLQEFCTFLYGAIAITLVISGKLSYAVLVLWYLMAVLVFLLNSLRTLAAHRYRNPQDHNMDIPEQFLDSVNIPGNPFITALWAPVGLRYHATHHLFPSMPYHNLGKAQRRLVRELSDNTLFLQTVGTSLWGTLTNLWQEATTRRSKSLSALSTNQ